MLSHDQIGRDWFICSVIASVITINKSVIATEVEREKKGTFIYMLNNFVQLFSFYIAIDSEQWPHWLTNNSLALH